MKVLAYDLYPNDSGKAIAEYVDLDTLLAQSDVVFLHCNLTPKREDDQQGQHRQDEGWGYPDQQLPRPAH